MQSKKKLAVIMSIAMLAVTTFAAYTTTDSVSHAESSNFYFHSTYESGNDGWEARGNANLQVSDIVHYKGVKSLYICDREKAWNGASYALDSATFKAGESYSFSAMVMQNSGSDEEMSMKVQYTDSATQTISYAAIAEVKAKDGEWTELSNKNYMIPEGASNVIVYIETPEKLINFFLDEAFGAKAGTVAETEPKAGVNDIIYGDLDGSKTVDVTDLTALSLFLLKSKDFDEEQLKKADVNDDGEINLADLAHLKQFIMEDKVILGPKVPDPPVTTEPPVTTPPAETTPSQTTPTETTKTPEAPEADPDANLDPKKLTFYRDSLYQMGNTSRICNKITKAKNGDNVTIAYLGGSITEGGGLETCYAKRSFNYFAQTYGKGNNVKYINAGLSGTSSAVGLMRCQKEILDAKPDVIFIEFSVNDHPEEIYKKSFDSLVKKCLSQENEPAVIILINRAQGGYSMQEQMVKVGQNYNVPVISMDKALTNAFKSGYLSPKDYFNDEYHPHANGCALISDCISYYYRQAYRTRNSAEPYVIPTTTAYGNEYESGTIVATSELQNFSAGSFKTEKGYGKLPYGLTYNKFTGNNPIKFKTTGKGIFIVFKAQQNSSLGILNVTVNGKTTPIDGKRLYSWGGPDADVAYFQKESGSLDVSMSMKDQGTDFTIWGIGVVK